MNIMRPVGLLTQKAKAIPLALCFLAGPTIAQAKVTITVLPGTQFVLQGGSAILKARVQGKGSGKGWIWQVVEPGMGTLEAVSHGRVCYRATGVEPWSSVRIRATSMEDPAVSDEAVIEVLPDPLFKVIKDVFDNPNWIEEASGQPESIQLQVTAPGLFAISRNYTLRAEIASWESDRFTWEAIPALGDLTRTGPHEFQRESMRYTPPFGITEILRIRIRVRSIESPEKEAETILYLPPDPALGDSGRPTGGMTYLPTFGASSLMRLLSRKC